MCHNICVQQRQIKGCGALVNSVCVCVCAFKKFQGLRKKNDEMKKMKVPSKRKRRRHKKGVSDNAMKIQCLVSYVDVVPQWLLC